MDRVSRATQENLLTLLVHSDTHGRLVAQRVKTEHFESDYRDIVQAVLEYWKEFKEAPQDDISVVLADVLEDRENKKSSSYRRILVSMLETKDTINAEYTLNSINKFLRMQHIKAALMESYEKIDADKDMSPEGIEAIWEKMLKVRMDNFDPGMRMTNISRLTDYLRNQDIQEFSTGIAVMDRAHVFPVRKKVMTFLAPSGRGKTWFLVGCAKKALMLRKRVAFISLEMDEEEITQRVYQSMFAAGKRAGDQNKRMDFKLNSLKRLEDIELIEDEPDFTFDSPSLREELETRLISSERLMENLIVKRFRPRSVDIADIASFLDNLEWTESFIPDIIILDYMGRIKTNLKEHRLGLGAQMEEYRGLCIERNAAGVTAMQVTRAGTKSGEVENTDVAEDISFVNTSDFILTQSQTKVERKYGIARVKASKVRGERDEVTALISQNFGIGQYCVQSIPFDKKIAEMLAEFDKDMDEDREDDEDRYDRDDEAEEDDER